MFAVYLLIVFAWFIQCTLLQFESSYSNMTQNMKAAPATFMNVFMNIILLISRLPYYIH